MLQTRNLSKSYGPTTIIADASLIINDGERVGLIGPNGVGKSTLLRCITGHEQPDKGTIVRSPADLTIGYLSQALDLPDGTTVGAFLAAAQADFTIAEQQLQIAADALSSTNDLEPALATYDSALARFDALGGYAREHRATAILDGLGLRDITAERETGSLSGGQKTRLGLAALLLGEPGLLLLDEPTNHLDIEALEWLEGFVTSYPRSVLIVSHDRAFLDSTVERIVHLDPETRSLRSYSGNYSDFAEARAQEHAAHVEAWKKQQEYVTSVRSDIGRLKGQALSVELTTTPSQPQVRRLAKKVAKKAKSRERKLERYLDSDERVEKPRQRWGIKLDFGEAQESGRAVVRVEQMGFDYATTIGDQEPVLLHDITFEIGYGERVAIVGPNGTGKTTLLRLLEGKLQPLTGRVRLGAAVRLGVLSQEHETLNPRQTILECVLSSRPMSETEARNFLHLFLFGGDSVFKPIEACSLGERSRLQLALLVLRGCNLLLLDEPLNHLDIDGREHFEEALDAFEGTVIAISHDRTFLHHFAERVLAIRDGQIHSYADYAEYLMQR
ncbi:MAG: ABC-F family ATP-binding cassette domain-containing protein [Roseiflexaceae bacterium]|nr:ABC-F family ATP-binding cassette domain-containing protein [Roseiflexaceae bacterium]